MGRGLESASIALRAPRLSRCIIYQCTTPVLQSGARWPTMPHAAHKETTHHQPWAATKVFLPKQGTGPSIAAVQCCMTAYATILVTVGLRQSCRAPAPRVRHSLQGRFRTERAQRGHSANYHVVYGNTPENHPPTEARMIHSTQPRGCRIQDPGTRGCWWWKTAHFPHSARTAHGAPPVTRT